MRLLSLILISLALLNANAQNGLPVKKLTIFKNATGMMVKEGTISTKNGVALLPIPQQTLFGTYFIGTAKDNSVKNIVFKNDTLKKKETAHEMWQLLSGNTGKQVTVSFSPGDDVDKSVSGKVLAYDKKSGVLKLSIDGNKNAYINAGSIYQLTFNEDPAAFYMEDSIQKMLVLKPEKNADALQLQEVYMSRGFNWLPSYFLKLKDDKNARLEMKATLENYAEDLKDAEVELVVGAPQMAYSNVMDPMTYDYISSNQKDDINNYAKGGYMQSNAVAIRYAAAADASFFTSTFQADGEKSGDMYIYKIGKVTMPYQSKGTYPIVAGNVEYRDKYEGTINDFTNFYATRYVPNDDKTYDIYHSLELKNTSSVPFTTASVMVMNEKDQFVAQDELKYTPVGSTTNIRLSKAVDLIMKCNEEEKNREDNARKLGKTLYSKVIIKGSVTIENYQDKEVTVTVSKNVFGTLLKADDNGKITVNKSYSYVNPSSDVKWEVKLSANQKKILNYEYEVFFTP